MHVLVSVFNHNEHYGGYRPGFVCAKCYPVSAMAAKYPSLHLAIVRHLQAQAADCAAPVTRAELLVTSLGEVYATHMYGPRDDVLLECLRDVGSGELESLAVDQMEKDDADGDACYVTPNLELSITLLYLY
jgi:hypothetical protein